MAQFSLIGDNNPFLHCHLKQGETIFCEANAMVMMEEGLELSGQLRGGLFQSLARRVANGESMFQQKISAVSAAGDCLLAPVLNGEMQIITIGEGQNYFINDGAFVACSESVQLEAKTNTSLSGALFGNTGGFFLMRTAGTGQIALSGAGAIFDIDITPEKVTTIDNGHVVCWDANLQYEVSTRTGGQGMFGSLVNSVTSGEGFVLKFRGAGKVYISSRNPEAYKGFLQSLVNGGN